MLDRIINKNELIPALFRAIVAFALIFVMLSGHPIPITIDIKFVKLLINFLLIYTLVSIFVPEDVKIFSIILLFIDSGITILLLTVLPTERKVFVVLYPLLIFSATLRFNMLFAFALFMLFSLEVIHNATATAITETNIYQILFFIILFITSAIIPSYLGEGLRKNKFKMLYLDIVKRNEELEDHIKLLEEKFSSQTIVDEITGLKNFRYFRTRIFEEISRAKRQNYPFCVAIAEIDDFDEIEKRVGKRDADILLRKIAKKLGEALRDTDLMGRYLKNQFVILLLQTNEKQATVPALRIKNAIANTDFGLGGQNRITISLGVSCYPADAQELGGLLSLASRAAEKSRKKGRGMITLAGALWMGK